MTNNKKDYMDDHKSFYGPDHQILQRLMEALSVSNQKELAKPLDTSQSTVSRWLKKERVPKEWVSKVSQEKGVSEYSLVGERPTSPQTIVKKPLEEMSPKDWKKVLEPTIKAAVGEEFSISLRSGGNDRSADIHIEITRIGYDALHEPPFHLRAAEEGGPYCGRKRGVTGHAAAPTSLGTGGRGQIITDLTGDDDETGIPKSPRPQRMIRVRKDKPDEDE